MYLDIQKYLRIYITILVVLYHQHSVLVIILCDRMFSDRLCAHNSHWCMCYNNYFVTFIQYLKTGYLISYCFLIINCCSLKPLNANRKRQFRQKRILVFTASSIYRQELVIGVQKSAGMRICVHIKHKCCIMYCFYLVSYNFVSGAYMNLHFQRPYSIMSLVISKIPDYTGLGCFETGNRKSLPLLPEF